MNTFNPLPIHTDPNMFTLEHLGLPDSDWGRKRLDEYRTQFRNWRGKVIRTVPKQELIRGLDPEDSRLTYWLEVTAWDDTAQRGVTFNVDGYEAHEKDANPKLASLWAPNYDNNSWTAYHRWYTTVHLHEDSLHKVSVKVAYEVAQIDEEIRKITALPTPARGQTYEVVAGRKYPRGTKGKLFWWGNNSWGESYGLALNDERDDRGRYKNVIFVATKNLQFVTTQVEIDAVNKLVERKVEISKEIGKRYSTMFYEGLCEWAKTYGYDAPVTLSRVISILEERGHGEAAKNLNRFVVAALPMAA